MKNQLESTVFVVDDDPDVRDGLRWLIESVGLKVELYDSAESFLYAYKSTRPGCLVLDVRMRGMSGLQLLENLRARELRLPVILLTGHGSVRLAVRAMKAGAVDVIEKPYADEELLDQVQTALRRDALERREMAERDVVAARMDSLTSRERQVLDLVVKGAANKVVAAELGIGERTVETHRKKIMDKMRAKSLAELVNLVLTNAKAPGGS